MATRADITPSLLRQLISFDPETGILTWKPRPLEMFASKRAHSIFVKRYEGKEAFTYLSYGYKTGAVLYVPCNAHRVAWAITYGKWPDSEIDHINGQRDDNRLMNLREVTSQENSRNCKVHRDSTTGHIGVDWLPRIGKYRARIYANGKNHHLGEFKKIEDAIAARKSADEQFGYHKNHGRN